MSRRTKTSLGIDIGSNRVTLALAAREREGVRLLRTVSGPISNETSRTSGVQDAKALSRAIRKLRRQGRIPRMKAAMGVSLSPLVLQMLDMPRQMPSNVGEFVENELRQYVTLSGRKIACDFCSAGNGRDSRGRLLSVAGDKEVIQRLVSACGAAGLTVESVEPSVLAYARAASKRDSTTGGAGTVLVVEINASQLSVCLLRHHMLDLVRTRGIPAEAGQNADAWLTEEVQTMMRHYDAEPSEGAAGWELHIVVRGEAPVTRNVGEFLRSRTGVPTEVADEACGGEDSSPQKVDSPSSGASAAALGLAMRQLDPDGNAWKVSLLPREVMQRRSLVRHVLTAANVAALIFLAMLLLPQIVTRTADRIRRDLDHQKMAEKLYTTPTLAAQSHRLDRQIAQTERQLRGMRKALQTPSRNWSHVLNAIAESAPTGVCITRLWSQDSQRLSVKGLALSCGAVQDFVQSLGQRDSFRSISLGSMERQQDARALVQYEMDCLMVPAQ
jgi:Tfp pilus assembly PilM family ATPase/Tfp pilus assembly protein PilN